MYDVIITGSIARSATRQYLIYSEADFKDFLPTGATRCTDGGEIWRPLLHAKFHPICATMRVYDPQTEIFTEI